MSLTHVICGSGVTGLATGTWLEANNETVIYNDIKADTIKKLKSEGRTVATNLKLVKDTDVFWICTAEWHIEDAMNSLPDLTRSMVVIRSTIEPDVLVKLCNKYKTPLIVHIPEFLRASSAINDVFNPDRVVIGTHNKFAAEKLSEFFKNLHVPIIITTPETSSLIKLVSNAWLSTQVNFWNEIKSLCDKYQVNPEDVANAVTLDERISKYGSNMTGSPFGLFCLPKDLDTIIKLFERKSLFDEVKRGNR